jgi:four helix bundle protein
VKRVQENKMNFAGWCETAPEEIKRDRVWRVKAYQMALFAADIAGADLEQFVKDRRTLALSDQLFRSVGSISANVAEGYSRSSRRDRARFYEYALGSAREARDWYCKGRHVLSSETVQHRLSLCSEIIRLLLTMIPEQRQASLRETELVYEIDSFDLRSDIPLA